MSLYCVVHAIPLALFFPIREGVDFYKTSVLIKRLRDMMARLSEDDEERALMLLGEIQTDTGNRHAAAQQLEKLLLTVFIRPDPRSLVADLVRELERGPSKAPKTPKDWGDMR